MVSASIDGRTKMKLRRVLDDGQVYEADIQAEDPRPGARHHFSPLTQMWEDGDEVTHTLAKRQDEDDAAPRCARAPEAQPETGALDHTGAEVRSRSLEAGSH